MFNNTIKTVAITSALMVMTGVGEPAPVDAATFSGETTANLHVRTGASTKYKVLGTLKKGTKVKVLSSSNGWYKVQYSNGKTGWSSAQYIKKSSSSSSSTSSSSTNATVKSSVNVRTGASTQYKVITTLKKGTKVNVLSSSNGWYKIQYSNGKTGWSSSRYISKSGSSSNSSNSSSSSNQTNRKMTVKAYAYTGGGYTATGTKAKYGTLAVDPRVIPYGTKVYIKELDKVFTAEDCGGGIKGNKVDIYMNSNADCYRWGVRTITIEILK